MQDDLAAAGRQAAAQRAASAQARLSRDAQLAGSPDPPSDPPSPIELPAIEAEYEEIQTPHGPAYARRNDYILVHGRGPVYLRDILASGFDLPAACEATGEAPAKEVQPGFCANCAPRAVHYTDSEQQGWTVDTPLPDAIDAVIGQVADAAADALEDAGAGQVVDAAEGAAERLGWLKRIRRREQKANDRLADAADAAWNLPGLRQSIDLAADAVNVGLAFGDWTKPGSRDVRVSGRGADSNREGRAPAAP